VETGRVREAAELIEGRNLAGLAASTTPARDFRLHTAASTPAGDQNRPFKDMLIFRKNEAYAKILTYVEIF
jgi:hypothetical protein